MDAQPAFLPPLAAVGTARELAGPKDGALRVTNLWFRAKIARVELIAAIAVPASRALRTWRDAARRDPAAVPSPADLLRARRQVRGAVHVAIGVLPAATRRAHGIGP